MIITPNAAFIFIFNLRTVVVIKRRNLFSMLFIVNKIHYEFIKINHECFAVFFESRFAVVCVRMCVYYLELEV